MKSQAASEATSCKIPSILYRIRTRLSSGSIWISEARAFIPSSSNLSSWRATGASTPASAVDSSVQQYAGQLRLRHPAYSLFDCSVIVINGFLNIRSSSHHRFNPLLCIDRKVFNYQYIAGIDHKHTQGITIQRYRQYIIFSWLHPQE